MYISVQTQGNIQKGRVGGKQKINVWKLRRKFSTDAINNGTTCIGKGQRCAVASSLDKLCILGKLCGLGKLWGQPGLKLSGVS